MTSLPYRSEAVIHPEVCDHESSPKVNPEMNIDCIDYIDCLTASLARLCYTSLASKLP